MTRRERLAAYLGEASRRRLEWGVFDCAIGLVAVWVERERGADWGEGYRGRYTTALGAQRLISRAGGLDKLMAGIAARHGFEETDEPTPGDAGVVLWRDVEGERLCCALRTGIGWAAMGNRGVRVAPAIAVKAWRV